MAYGLACGASIASSGRVELPSTLTGRGRTLREKQNHGSPPQCFVHLYAWFGQVLGPGTTMSVLDVGGGTGDKTVRLRKTYERFGHSFACIDVVPSGSVCSKFDGQRIPRHDDSQDIVFFSYALHHAGDHALPLLLDASRVSRRYLVVLEDLKADTMDMQKAEATHLGCTPQIPCVFRGDDEWRAIFELLPQWELVHVAVPNRSCARPIPRRLYVLKRSRYGQQQRRRQCTLDDMVAAVPSGSKAMQHYLEGTYGDAPVPGDERKLEAAAAALASGELDVVWLDLLPQSMLANCSGWPTLPTGPRTVYTTQNRLIPFPSTLWIYHHTATPSSADEANAGPRVNVDHSLELGDGWLEVHHSKAAFDGREASHFYMYLARGSGVWCAAAHDPPCCHRRPRQRLSPTSSPLLPCESLCLLSVLVLRDGRYQTGATAVFTDVLQMAIAMNASVSSNCHECGAKKPALLRQAATIGLDTIIFTSHVDTFDRRGHDHGGRYVTEVIALRVAPYKGTACPNNTSRFAVGWPDRRMPCRCNPLNSLTFCDRAGTLPHQAHTDPEHHRTSHGADSGRHS